jgi:hypothetical protein
MIFLWANGLKIKKKFNDLKASSHIYSQIPNEIAVFREYSIPPERKFKLIKRSIADGFLSFFHTRGATPSSFAPGYQYFAHTGLNPNLKCNEFRMTINKSSFFKFALTFDRSVCVGRQNARPSPYVCN